MSWYVFIALSKVFDASSTIFSKNIFTKKKVDPISFVILYGLTTGVSTALVGIFLPNFGVLSGKEFPWINMLIMCVLYGFGSIFFYKGMSMVEASRLAIISASGTVFTILSSVILLGEQLSPYKYIGGVIIVIGIIITNYRKGEFKFGKGELFVLLGSAFFGLQVINDKYIMTQMGTYFYLALAYLLPLFFIVPFFWKSAKKVRETLKAIGWKSQLFYTFLLLAQAICFFMGLNISDSPSLVTMFALSGRVLLVIMSILILKETSNLKQKIIGTIVVVLGLALLG